MLFSMYYLNISFDVTFLSPRSLTKTPFFTVFCYHNSQGQITNIESIRYIQAFEAAETMAKAPSGYFNILYFASASSFTGKDDEFLPATVSLTKLFAELESRYPGIKAKILDSCLVTVNLDYVDVPGEDCVDDTVIQEGDEVAIIPPVSSG